MRLKRIHWLILQSFIGPFIATFFVSLFLFLMQFLWAYLEDMVGKGLEWYIIAEFIFYSAIHLIPMALPLAVLLSSIMTFGNLGERYELVAIKSAGVSIIRAMRPMIAVSLILAIIAFYTTNIIIPKANLNWGALLYDVTHKKPALNLKDGVFYRDLDGYAIRVGKKHEDNTLEDILIYSNLSKGTNADVIMAKRGKMEITPDDRFMLLTLEDGQRYEEMRDNQAYYKSYPHNVMKFKHQEMAISLVELQFKRTKKELFKEDYRMLNVLELEIKKDSLDSVLDRRYAYMFGYLKPYLHFPKDSVVNSYSFIGKQFEKALYQTISEMVYLDNKSVATEDNVYKAAVPSDTLTQAFQEKKNRLTKERTRKSVFNNDPLAQKEEGFGSLASGEAVDRQEVIDKALNSARSVQKVWKQNFNATQIVHKQKRYYQIEWHKKFTLAVSCIVLFFVGAPLGAIIRKGGFGIPLVVSILLFIIYYIINVTGEKMAKDGVFSMIGGLWMSTAFFFPLALFLSYKASTDSRLFDSDAYTKLFAFLRFEKRGKKKQK